MGFYLNAVLSRLKGTPLQFKHEDTFKAPQIQSQEEWEKLVADCYTAAESLAKEIEHAPAEKLEEINPGNQYSYYKNLHGVVEHTYYHLGQIVLLKKLVRSKTA